MKDNTLQKKLATNSRKLQNLSFEKYTAVDAAGFEKSNAAPGLSAFLGNVWRAPAWRACARKGFTTSAGRYARTA